MTRRAAEDHVHVDAWTKTDQHRFEDNVTFELREIRKDLESLTSRVLMIFGGVALLAFIIPLVVPIVRDWLSIPTQVIP